MPGTGRKTHDFPSGTPTPVIVLWIAWPILFFVWVVFGGGISQGWRHWLPFVAVAVGIVFVYSRVIAHYERTGQAIPIRKVIVVTKFPNGLPKPMFVARASFFVTAALMVFFAIRCAQSEAARNGVVGCVGGLIIVAVVNLRLESYYVKGGRAVEVEVKGPRATGRVKRLNTGG